MAGPDTVQQLEHLRLAAELGDLSVDEYILPDDHHVVIRGHRLHYLDWPAEEGGARDVLLLHGGGLTAHTWDLVCLALRPHYHCVAMDQRGHGDSEWSPNLDYSRGAHLADLEGLVDLLGLDHFVLIGMSLGGLNSIEFAGRHSSHLKALVLVDVGPEVQAPGAQRIRDFMAADDEFDSVEEVIERALAFNKQRNPELLRTSLLHNLRRLPDGKWTWKYDRRPRFRMNSDAINKSIAMLAERVPSIRCPTLVIRGANSDVFTDDQAERLATQLPDGRWVKVENAGHTVQGDNPRGLVDALRSFFADIGA